MLACIRIQTLLSLVFRQVASTLYKVGLASCRDLSFDPRLMSKPSTLCRTKQVATLIDTSCDCCSFTCHALHGAKNPFAVLL